VHHEHDQRYHEQQVDEPPGNVSEEAHDPAEDEENAYDCEHNFRLLGRSKCPFLGLYLVVL